MKMSDVLINVLLKKGVLGEFRNFETEIQTEEGMKITIKAENLQVRLDKEDK